MPGTTTDNISSAARLFQDASDFDDRITSLSDIARMEDRLSAATAELRALLDADELTVGVPKALLEQALRVSYLDQERAALILRNLVRFRREQGWPLRIEARSCEVALRTRVHYILPEPDIHGRAVLVFNAGLVNTSVCPVKEFHRMASFVMEQLTADPAVQHRGIAILLNLEGAHVGMAASFSWADIKRGISMYRDCFPCKVKLLAIVNASAIQRRLLALALALVHPRVRARVEVAASLAELHKGSMPARMLPAEFGGPLDSQRLWDDWCAGRWDMEEACHRKHMLPPLRWMTRSSPAASPASESDESWADATAAEITPPAPSCWLTVEPWVRWLRCPFFASASSSADLGASGKR